MAVLTVLVPAATMVPVSLQEGEKLAGAPRVRQARAMSDELTVHEIRHGWANCFLLDAGDGLTLIDTGRPGFLPGFHRLFKRLGRPLSDLRHIVLTHTHPDHVGNARDLQRLSDAEIVTSAEAATMLAAGETFRPHSPRPDLIGRLVERLVVSRAARRIEPVPVHRTVADGDSLPVAGGLEVIATPGHATGHLAFRSPQHGGILFAGDAMVSLPWLNLPFVAEDWEQTQASAHRLATLQVETAYFGHGRPLRSGATRRLRGRWGRLHPTN